MLCLSNSSLTKLPSSTLPRRKRSLREMRSYWLRPKWMIGHCHPVSQAVALEVKAMGQAPAVEAVATQWTTRRAAVIWRNLLKTRRKGQRRLLKQSIRGKVSQTMLLQLMERKKISSLRGQILRMSLSNHPRQHLVSSKVIRRRKQD